MPLTFTLDPSVNPALRDGILDLWTDVTNAGGAVGFVAPVSRETIRPELVKHFVAMAEGRARLLVGHDENVPVVARPDPDRAGYPADLLVTAGGVEPLQAEPADVFMLLPLT